MELLRAGYPPQFQQDHSAYAGIGLVIVWVSWLEQAIQDFIFCCHTHDERRTLKAVKEALEQRGNKKLKRNPSLPGAKHFPDVVVFLLVEFSELRREPLWSDGSLDLNSIGYSIEEVFDVRNHLAHGAIEVIEVDGGTTTYQAKKLSRVPEARSKFRTVRYKLSERLLEKTCYDAKRLTKYVESIGLALDGKSCWEVRYQQEKKEKADRRFIQDWVLADNFAVSPMMKLIVGYEAR